MAAVDDGAVVLVISINELVGAWSEGVMRQGGDSFATVISLYSPLSSLASSYEQLSSCFC